MAPRRLSAIIAVMARVRSITTGNQNVGRHPSEVDCTVQAVLTDDGATLMQLSSFGSDARASHPKVSQTLQFDREAARILRNYIDQCFPPR